METPGESRPPERSERAISETSYDRFADLRKHSLRRRRRELIVIVASLVGVIAFVGLLAHLLTD
jgi:hypothetical protein